MYKSFNDTCRPVNTRITFTNRPIYCNKIKPRNLHKINKKKTYQSRTTKNSKQNHLIE